MADGYVLLVEKGWGSAIVEAMLTLAGLPYTAEPANYGASGPDRERLTSLNPLGQVPVLILPDGSAMTESAAMVLHIGDVAPAAGLVPPSDAPSRVAFLRWLVFLVAAVYPTFTYGDTPSRFVSGEAAGGELRASTDRQREALWRLVEGSIAPSPWWLGSQFTALDVYVAVMTQWRPRRAWFSENCPKLHAIAQAVDTRPELAAVWRRNFD
jgi:GST-like protein